MGRDQKLDDQMAECRELLTEVRGATKDLHAAIKEAKATFPELAQDQISEAVGVELTKVMAATTKFIDAAEVKISRRFDHLVNLLLTGHPQGRTKPGKLNVESLVEEVAEARRDGRDVKFVATPVDPQ